jgi:AraC-like DNA-binding protein
MKPALEAPRTILNDDSFAAFERKENAFVWNWHYHPEIELTWIGQGQGTRLVGDHSDSYDPHDLVILGSNLPHTWFSPKSEEHSRKNQAIVIQFRPEMFPETLLALPEFTSIKELFTRATRGVHFPKTVGRKMGGKLKALLRKRGLSRWLDLADILNELAASSGTVLASPGYHHQRSYKLSSRLGRIIAHIEEHYKEETTLAEIATMAGLTPSAFSRFFRKMTDKTFVSYRNDCRVREACRLLTETDLPIIEIAYECGFNNLANFHRRFRENKYTVPREYRRLHNPVPETR